MSVLGLKKLRRSPARCPRRSRPSEFVKYGAIWLREQQDADREDDRDDAGLVDPERQERLAALVHPPAADAARVLDRDPALALLDVDDHARPRRWRGREQAMAERAVRRLEEAARRRAGARLTMPAKMMKLMPLPIPFSVISSPSHISDDRAGGQGRRSGSGSSQLAEVEAATIRIPLAS